MKSSWIGAVVLGAALVGAPVLAHAQKEKDLGKAEFDTSCAVCHGVDAKGKGPVSEWLKKPAADLTTLQKKNGGVFPFNRVYEVIDGREAVPAHGPYDMPIWGDTFNKDAVRLFPYEGTEALYASVVRAKILALIAYLSTIQQK